MTKSNKCATWLAAGAATMIGCGGASSTLADGVDGGGTSGGNGAVVSSGGSPSDAGPGGTAQSLPCGSTSCAIPDESCCVYDIPAFLCVIGPVCPVLDAGGGGRGTGTGLTCSGAANCSAGTLCCVFENASKQVVSTCMTACPSGGAQLCDPNAASSGCAPGAGACSSKNVTDWDIPSTYATCGGIGS